MEPHQVELVKTSWSNVKPIAMEAMTEFYDRLFEIAPDTRSLFDDDLQQQKIALSSMLNMVVVNLDRLPLLLPKVQDLGRRHAGYGVRPDHYAAVGQALLQTLANGLGDAFDQDTEQAWTVAIQTLAGVMIDAATEPA